MPDVNLTLLVGRACQDARLRHIAGRQVTNFTLATHSVFRRSDGQVQRRDSFHEVAIWGDLAQGAVKHIKRGKLVAVRGEIRYRDVEHAGRNFQLATVVAGWFNTPPETSDPGGPEDDIDGADDIENAGTGDDAGDGPMDPDTVPGGQATETPETPVE